MAICRSCGSINRDSARFCLQCAEPLADRHTVDDQEWLAATLALVPASPSVVAVPPTPEVQEYEGGTMTKPTPEQPDMIIAGRYEILSRVGDAVEVVDRQPWQRCWSCGTSDNEAGELFCTQCGANLDGRRYRGQVVEAEPVGLALVTTVADPQAREILPPIWDQVGDSMRTLTLIAETGRTPLKPPLEELDALYVGRGLAHLLAALHAVGLQLGSLSPEQLEMTPGRLPRLREVPALRTAPDEQDPAAADLAALAALLAQLTQTPRTTRRLDEDSAATALQLPDLLREVRTGTISTAAALAERLDALILDRTAPISLAMRVGMHAHEGMVRELNEDSLLALELTMLRMSQPRTWGLFMVADGMGGHSAGEVASDLALRGAYEVVQRAYLSPTVDTDVQDDEEQLREIVRQAIRQANEYVLREARARGNDMGTTLTMALVVGDRAVIGNVGDSRTYLMRNGTLKRVSKDHSLVQRLVDLGQIEPDDMYTHPQRNAVLRSLGDKSDVEIDIFTERLQAGDALLLMSDGQWEMTRDPQMIEILNANPDPQAACHALI
ncbi:MAG TPA: protein phosphatase 2C domain-containing protein, partial [Roseiflexaceae bacterium]|nr:protein phosphatase 2C domain-containing protein [Roseiflexaceae bacterium]